MQTHGAQDRERDSGADSGTQTLKAEKHRNPVDSDRVPESRGQEPRVRQRPWGQKFRGDSETLKGTDSEKGGQTVKQGERNLERGVRDSEVRTNVQRRGLGEKDPEEEDRDSNKRDKVQRKLDQEARYPTHCSHASPQLPFSGHLRRTDSWSLCFHLGPLESILFLGPWNLLYMQMD